MTYNTERKEIELTYGDVLFPDGVLDKGVRTPFGMVVNKRTAQILLSRTKYSIYNKAMIYHKLRGSLYREIMEETDKLESKHYYSALYIMLVELLFSDSKSKNVLSDIILNNNDIDGIFMYENMKNGIFGEIRVEVTKKHRFYSNVLLDVLNDAVSLADDCIKDELDENGDTIKRLMIKKLKIELLKVFLNNIKESDGIIGDGVKAQDIWNYYDNLYKFNSVPKKTEDNDVENHNDDNGFQNMMSVVAIVGYDC